jgi:predicted  nucleic acid-binding Zn-ribbon protein
VSYEAPDNSTNVVEAGAGIENEENEMSKSSKSDKRNDWWNELSEVGKWAGDASNELTKLLAAQAAISNDIKTLKRDVMENARSQWTKEEIAQARAAAKDKREAVSEDSSDIRVRVPAKSK